MNCTTTPRFHLTRLLQIVLLALLASLGTGCGDLFGADDMELVSVAYGDGKFVAVGHRLDSGGEDEPPSDNALIAVSKDGKNWKSIAINDEAALFDVAYGNGKFVAVGGRVTGRNGFAPHRELRILTSSDGDQWTEQPAEPREGTLLDIAFGGGAFVATSSGDIMRSADGGTWQFHPNRELIGTDGIDFIDDEFFGWGSGDALFRSTDGITWTEENVEDVRDIWHLARVNGEWFGTAVEGISRPNELDPEGPLMLRSTDGITWTITRPFREELPRDFAYGSGVYTAVFHERAPMTSTDGTNWKATGADDVKGTDMLFADGRFVTVGPEGIFTSRDGKKWTQRLEMGDF